MKHFFNFIFLAVSVSLYAQEQKHSLFYYQKVSLFEKLSINKKDIVMLGNSITDGGEWHELFANKRLKNRGISGDTTQGVLDRLDNIIKGKPSKIFLMIGINDIAKGISKETIVQNIEKIILKTKEKSPKTKIYIQSILPTNPNFSTSKKYMKPEIIQEINQNLEELSVRHQIIYIDLYRHFVEATTNNLNPIYTNDGLHLMGEGYFLWKKIISNYL